MISFTSEQWSTLLMSFLWPLARILGMVGTMPILGSASITARVKILLGVALAILVAPGITVPHVEPWSAQGFALLFLQFLIGVCMSFAMSVAFTAVDFAGEISGLQMGLGFASFFDPQNANPEPVVSQLFGLLGTLVFLSINGHLLLLGALVHSFEVMPLDRMLPSGMWMTLAELGGQIFYSGFMLSLPIIAVLLVINLVLGVLTRAAPQLSLFSVGFPLTLMIGGGVMLLVLPHLGDGMVVLFERMLNFSDKLFEPA